MKLKYSGQSILFFLSNTDTPTTGGLKSFFEESNIPLLVLSVAWSLRSCVSLHIRALTLEKPFFPTTSKLVAYLWTITVTAKRMMVLILYFAPSLGLFHLLYHPLFEQVPFAVRKNRNVSADDLLYLYNIDPLPWTDVDRWSYEDPNNPKPPSYTVYTVFTIGEYFQLFWIIFALHICCNIISKLFTSKQFRKEANLLQMLIHGIENCNIPLLWKDWDEDSGTVEDHIERFKSSNYEMFATFLVNFIFNAAMLLPLGCTG